MRSIRAPPRHHRVERLVGTSGRQRIEQMSGSHRGLRRIADNSDFAAPPRDPDLCFAARRFIPLFARADHSADASRPTARPKPPNGRTGRL